MTLKQESQDDLQKISDRISSVADAIEKQAQQIDEQVGYLQELGDFEGTFGLIEQVDELRSIGMVLKKLTLPQII
ncbi:MULTISPECIES: hypothetical protein [unclassified Leptolyngbya]|uniref:hypothetical protein n=1 Tax=unclassified Leptolyngbya TaxID=2650499 RepID=UPI003D3156EF